MPRQPLRPSVRCVRTLNQSPAQIRGWRHASSVATRSLFRLRRYGSPPCLRQWTPQQIHRAGGRKEAQVGDVPTLDRLKRRGGRVRSPSSRSNEKITAHGPLRDCVPFLVQACASGVRNPRSQFFRSSLVHPLRHAAVRRMR